MNQMNQIVHKEYLINALKSFESQIINKKYISIEQFSTFKKEVENIIDSFEVPSGKNIQIAKIEPIVGGNKITFIYYDDSNEQQTSTMDVMNGEKGTSVVGAKIKEDNILILELSDGQEIEAGQIILNLDSIVLDGYYTTQQSDEKFVQKIELNSLIQNYLDSTFQKIESEEIKNIFRKEMN